MILFFWRREKKSDVIFCIFQSKHGAYTFGSNQYNMKLIFSNARNFFVFKMRGCLRAIFSGGAGEEVNKTVTDKRVEGKKYKITRRPQWFGRLTLKILFCSCAKQQSWKHKGTVAKDKNKETSSSSSSSTSTSTTTLYPLPTFTVHQCASAAPKFSFTNKQSRENFVPPSPDVAEGVKDAAG